MSSLALTPWASAHNPIRPRPGDQEEIISIGANVFIVQPSLPTPPTPWHGLKEFPFLELNAEIRLLVYSFLLSASGPIHSYWSVRISRVLDLFDV